MKNHPCHTILFFLWEKVVGGTSDVSVSVLINEDPFLLVVIAIHRHLKTLQISGLKFFPRGGIHDLKSHI